MWRFQFCVNLLFDQLNGMKKNELLIIILTLSKKLFFFFLNNFDFILLNCVLFLKSIFFEFQICYSVIFILWFVIFYTCFPCFGRNCYCCIFLFICFSGILLLLTVRVYIFPVELKAKWSLSYYKLRRKSLVINRTSFVILVVVWS
jgi:hypothetical protein